MFPLLIGAGLLLTAGGGVAYVEKRKKKAFGNQPGGGHPIPGMPTSGPNAPVGLTNPGVPQPAGLVINLPPIADPPQDLHDAAANVMQNIAIQGTPSTGPAHTVAVLQAAYNKTNPPVKLATDGIYAAKTQAVLQSIVTPAVAPPSLADYEAMLQGALGKGPVVATPANPAPAPIGPIANDITIAAKVLYDFLNAGGNKKGSFREVTTFQTAWNGHIKNQPLIADGQYGGNGQNALQSVLNWMGTGLKAPKNPYGAPKTGVPIFVT